MSDWTTLFAATATAGGAVAAIYGGLTYHRDSTEEHAVKWSVEIDKGTVVLVCLGPRDALDVEAAFTTHVTVLAHGSLHRDRIAAGSRMRLGTIAPGSAWQPMGAVQVAYSIVGAFGRKKKDTWTSELV